MPAVAINPEQVVKDALSALPQVEQVYLWASHDKRITVLTVIETRDYSLQKQVFRAEAEIIDALPGFEVAFDLIIHEGRSINELITPRGTLLFARA